MAKFRNGDRVVVPFGPGDEIEGTVVDSFGPPGREIVSVRIYYSDDPEAVPDDIGFRADSLRHVAPA